jgi:hypothetical protein
MRTGFEGYCCAQTPQAASKPASKAIDLSIG